MGARVHGEVDLYWLTGCPRPVDAQEWCRRERMMLSLDKGGIWRLEG